MEKTMQSQRAAYRAVFTLTAVAVLSLSPVLGSALALEGPGRALLPSQTLLQAKNDPIISATGEHVQRTFIPPYSGTVRVQWEVRSSDGTIVFGGAGVQGLAFCAKDTMSTTFTSKACHVRVAAGMPLYIFASPDSDTNTASLRNVRVYYRVVDSDGKMIVYDDLPVLEAAASHDRPQ
jgi:hypothetical protein